MYEPYRVHEAGPHVLTVGTLPIAYLGGCAEDPWRTLSRKLDLEHVEHAALVHLGREIHALDLHQENLVFGLRCLRERAKVVHKRHVDRTQNRVASLRRMRVARNAAQKQRNEHRARTSLWPK